VNDWLGDSSNYQAKEVIYLLQKGRKKEAQSKFEEVISTAKFETKEDYFGFHVKIAKYAVWWVNLDFAVDILGKIPYKYLVDPVCESLANDILVLKEVDRFEEAVFPWDVNYLDWWKGPHLNFPKEVDGKAIKSWFPFKLTDYGADGVHAVMAKLEGEEVVYGYLHPDNFSTDFIKENLVAGINLDNNWDDDFRPFQFGEICFYGEKEIPKINLYKKGPRTPPAWQQTDWIQPVYEWEKQ